MRTSTATVSLSGGLADKMRACAAAGFDGIELFEPDLVVAPESPEEIRALAGRLGLGLELYQPFRDFEGVDEETLRENLRRAERKFGVMRRLGMDLVLVCSNVGTAVTGDPDVATAQLGRLAELAERHGVRIAYEALAWGQYVSDYRDAWALVDAVGHPNLGICLDSFHILSRGHDPAGIEKIPADKLFFLQIADAPALTMDVLSWSRHHRLFPGEGSFDLPAFLAHTLRAGYRGPLSLEVFNDVFRQTETVRTAEHSLRSLLWLENETAALLSGGPAREVATLSAVDDPTGMSFAEIRAEDTEGVENVLFQLGLEFGGHHRSKPVRLWSEGGARVVLNEQRSRGTAPRLAAVGLDVPGVDASVRRARELRAPRVFRRVQADEEPLEAVTAPDGTEIFLCRPAEHGSPAWVGEFRFGSPGPPGDAAPLLTGIDHVNLVQPYENLDEAVLFYRSLLSLDVTSGSEVAGPAGLVRSQVMTSHDQGVRLVLNVPPGPPQGSRDLSQHVAFATADAVAVARRARDRGLDVLPIPGNYYDDLAARYALPDRTLEDLRALNLLYDRAGDGEFVHFYTRTVGSVFFEVVERRAGYAGFGAPNAPVRLAAQNRVRR